MTKKMKMYKEKVRTIGKKIQQERERKWGENQNQ